MEPVTSGTDWVVNFSLPLSFLTLLTMLARNLWRDWLERKHAQNGGTEGQKVVRGVETIAGHMVQIHRDHNTIIEGQKEINKAFDSNRMTSMYERGVTEGVEREQRRRSRENG